MGSLAGGSHFRIVIIKHSDARVPGPGPFFRLLFLSDFLSFFNFDGLDELRSDCKKKSQNYDDQKGDDDIFWLLDHDGLIKPEGVKLSNVFRGR